MRAIESRPSADRAPIRSGALSPCAPDPKTKPPDLGGKARRSVGEFMIDVAVRGTDAAAGSEPTVLAVGRLHRKALTLPEAYGLDR